MSTTGQMALLAGDADTAMTAFAATVAQNPADADARYWLAAALIQAGEPAQDVLNDARTLQTLALLREAGVDLAKLKSDPAYAQQVGTQLYAQHLVACASVVWGMALGAGQIDGMGLLNYALSLQHQGRVEEASQYLKVAVENFPTPGLHHFLVYAELFCQDGERRHADEARAWAARWANFPPPGPHANPPLAGRKLKVGYVAPRFADSQLRQFITPVLEGHDPEAVEVVLYPADAASETQWPTWIEVHPIGELSDAEAADLIRRDGVDVLNDCWGHTAGSRLGVFARKPAPVQAAWINFAQTTGLPQMDYVLHAHAPDAPDFEGLFSEAIWAAAPVAWPFRPAAGRLPPVPTPAKRTGKVTFGSFNHPAKLSDEAIAAWATVLRNAPGSRLLLKYRYYADPVLQNETQARFGANGVSPGQLVFEGQTSGEDYYRAFQGVDLMLDCWPAPGSTTTLEALSNGVPVLSMVGAPPNVGCFYARSILAASGLDDLITDSPEAFVARALELARDPEALDALRARVRPGFDGGAVCDEAGFVRTLEDSFRQMFERSQAVSSAPAAAAGGVR